MAIPRADLQQLSTYQDIVTGILPPTIASATIISPTHFLSKVSGTVQIATINPVTAGAHLICLVFTDASPGTFLLTGNIGKAITPVQNNALFLMFDPILGKYFPGAVDAGSSSQIANTSFLVSGGQIIWTSAYNFTVTAAEYFILGNLYNSPQTDISLAAAHATLDRIDLVIVNTSSTVQVITGVAAAQPSEPDYDPGSQLKLGFIFVTHNTTQPPTALNTVLYANNAGGPTEWNWVDVGTGFVTNSITNPIPPNTFVIEGTDVPAGDYVEGTTTPAVLAGSYDSLVLFIRSKAAWGNGRGLNLTFRSGGVIVGLNVPINRTGSFGFNSTILGVYQAVSIPISQFALAPSQPLDGFRITGFGGPIGMFIGNIILQRTGATTITIGLTQEEADARYHRIAPSLEVNLGNSGTALAVDLQSEISRAFFLTLTGNCTITMTNPVFGANYLFIAKQDGTGSRTLTFSPAPLWAGGVAPVATPAANAVSLFTLTYSVVNGGKFVGAANLANA